MGAELLAWGLWVLESLGEAGLIVAITIGLYVGLLLAVLAVCVVVVMVGDACLSVYRRLTRAEENGHAV